MNITPVRSAEAEIDLACRTLLATTRDVVRSISVIVPGTEATGTTPCAATAIADDYGLDALVTCGRGVVRVRLVRRQSVSADRASASPGRR